ncbi:Ig-like domain-containing protein [Pontibacter beigongshangensis]|uniref:Ig-like domain-containing protein n=1 Tax=Pontibacter beigongshangensis TaxID=2574733 RepID=UPI00164F3066|nr:Ig-like domain-containing protein [Pontibacter beigongshangensis]
MLLSFIAQSTVSAQNCSNPGRDGVLSGGTTIINTYYPATQSVTAGANKSILLGKPTGSTTPIATGDLVLIIQMQGVDITSPNDATYGTESNNIAGIYEYAVATSDVPKEGGSLTVAYLHNSYTNSDFSPQGQKRYQVIRVPQYMSATLGATLTTPAWNGTTGGVVVLDVAGNLNFNGNGINVTGLGFRGGAGRQMTGATGLTNADYRSSATLNAHAQKGEGIAGTPRHVLANGATASTDTGFEGYPNGSMARGAAGNAGGGGTDGNPGSNNENSGGGGGANGGIGGQGGNAWNSGRIVGGFGGRTFSSVATTRLVMGGGGGAGTTNDGSGSPAGGLASSGAAGGGIILVRSGSVSGTGFLTANGANANSTVANDGSGGGGAGGSVIVTSLTGVLNSVTVNANGGTGGSNTGGGSAHGPGGGGGGGVIYANGALVAARANAGTAGTTAVSANYGATTGGAGIVNPSIARPVLIASSGPNCAPVALDITTGPVTAAATPILPLLGYDTDGTIAGYKFTTLPTAAQGLLYSNGTTVNTTSVYTQQQVAQLSFAPTGTFTGNVTFTYTAIDNAGAEDSTPATYTIPLNTNTPPVVYNVTTAPIANTAAATSISALAATDPDGSIASFTIQTLPTTAQGVLHVNSVAAITGQTITPEQATQLRFDPAATFTGNATFSYTATDNQGAVADPSATYTIPVVASTNIAPIAYDVRSNQITSTNKDNPGHRIILTPPFNAIDPDGGISFFTILSLPSTGILYNNGTAVVIGNSNAIVQANQLGNLTYHAPTAGPYTFSYRATDNLEIVSNTATYTLHVNENPLGNNAPTANPIINPAISNKGGNATILPLAGTDPDAGNTIRSYTIASLPTAAQGVLYVNGVAATTGQILNTTQAAQLSFTPSSTFTGNASFTYRATDNFGSSSTAAAIYTIPVTTPPVANNVTTSAVSNKAANAPISPLSATDLDGSIATYTIVTLPTAGQGVLYANGEAARAGQILNTTQAAQLTFAPVSTFSGNATFTFRATDNQGIRSNTALYTIPILAPPTAYNLTSSINTATTEKNLNPLSATCPDTRSISYYTIIALPPTTEGILLVNGVEVKAGDHITPSQAEQLTFEPAEYFLGTSTFSYTATDEVGITSAEPASYAIVVINSTLPVSLMKFTAQAQQKGVKLDWATATEENNDYFEIERSQDGKTFGAIGKVKGAGNSSMRLDYTFLDAQAPAGISYYRLKQVDFDGTYTFSKVVTATSKGMVTGTHQTQTYPNPFSDALTVELTTLLAGQAQLQLIDLQGKIVYAKQIEVSKETNRYELPTYSLTPGMYILTITGNGIQEKVKVVKAH